jgi:hypothetical protein
MVGPRDPVPAADPAGLTDRQQHHLAAIQSAGEALLEAMHWAEGSSPPGQHQEHVFMSRRMNIAATQVEIAMLMARKAALEAK